MAATDDHGDVPVELPAAVALTRCEDGKLVPARLVELTAKLAKTKIGPAWWAGLGISKYQRNLEGDHHWDWAAEIGKYRNSMAVESVAVQTNDRDIQGAIIYRIDAQSVLSPGSGAVLIDRLATAPRNRDWLVEKPLYRGSGTNMVRWAAYQSHILGFSGRIVLATLPDSRTVEFYESLGFRETDAEEDDMIIFELEPESAAVFLKSAKQNS